MSTRPWATWRKSSVSSLSRLARVSDVRVVMTLRADGDAELLEAQRAFHLAAGVDAIVDPGDIVATETDWVLPAAPGEFWWPRGGSLREVLSAIPGEYDVVQALVRPFVASETAAGGDLEQRLTHRLSAQAMLDNPAGSPRPARRLAHRAGVDVSAYEGEIPKAALRPLRGWYPIEVLATGGQTLPQSDIDEGLANGTIQLDTRLRDALRATGDGREIEFPRPTVAENAWFAVDAAVLGEADAFGIRDDIDALERRLAELEENLGVRIERKLRSLVRRGSRAT
jgi:hypothetical protein